MLQQILDKQIDENGEIISVNLFEEGDIALIVHRNFIRFRLEFCGKNFKWINIWSYEISEKQLENDIIWLVQVCEKRFNFENAPINAMIDRCLEFMYEKEESASLSTDSSA